MSKKSTNANLAPVEGQDWPHLGPLARAQMTKSGADRILFTKEDRWLPYEAAEEILEDLQELVGYPKVIRPPCRLIVAPAHHGKSHILMRFCKKNPITVLKDGSGKHIPVLYIQSPPVPSEIRLYGKILKALGSPARDSDNLRRLERELWETVGSVGLRVLLIDEIHHAICGNSKQHHAFLQAMKHLTTELGISIVGAGVEKARNAIQTDSQLETRFEEVDLKLWNLDKEFQTFLASMEQVLPLAYPSGLAEPSLAEKIHTLSGGITGQVVKLLRAAFKKAVKDGTERITHEVIDGCGYKAYRSSLSLAEEAA